MNKTQISILILLIGISAVTKGLPFTNKKQNPTPTPIPTPTPTPQPTPNIEPTPSKKIVYDWSSALFGAQYLQNFLTGAEVYTYNVVFNQSQINFLYFNGFLVSDSQDNNSNVIQFSISDVNGNQSTINYTYGFQNFWEQIQVFTPAQIITDNFCITGNDTCTLNITISLLNYQASSTANLTWQPMFINTQNSSCPVPLQAATQMNQVILNGNTTEYYIYNFYVQYSNTSADQYFLQLGQNQPNLATLLNWSVNSNTSAQSDPSTWNFPIFTSDSIANIQNQNLIPTFFTGSQQSQFFTQCEDSDTCLLVISVLTMNFHSTYTGPLVLQFQPLANITFISSQGSTIEGAVFNNGSQQFQFFYLNEVSLQNFLGIEVEGCYQSSQLTSKNLVQSNLEDTLKQTVPLCSFQACFYFNGTTTCGTDVMEASEVPSNNVSSLVNTFNAPASPGYYFIIVMSEVYNTPNAEVDFNLTTYNAAGLALIGSNTNFSQTFDQNIFLVLNASYQQANTLTINWTIGSNELQNLSFFMSFCPFNNSISDCVLPLPGQSQQQINIDNNSQTILYGSYFGYVIILVQSNNLYYSMFNPPFQVTLNFNQTISYQSIGLGDVIFSNFITGNEVFLYSIQFLANETGNLFFSGIVNTNISQQSGASILIQFTGQGGSTGPVTYKNYLWNQISDYDQNDLFQNQWCQNGSDYCLFQLNVSVSNFTPNITPVQFLLQAQALYMNSSSAITTLYPNGQMNQVILSQNETQEFTNVACQYYYFSSYLQPSESYILTSGFNAQQMISYMQYNVITNPDQYPENWQYPSINDYCDSFNNGSFVPQFQSGLQQSAYISCSDTNACGLALVVLVINFNPSNTGPLALQLQNTLNVTQVPDQLVYESGTVQGNSTNMFQFYQYSLAQQQNFIDLTVQGCYNQSAQQQQSCIFQSCQYVQGTTICGTNIFPGQQGQTPQTNVSQYINSNFAPAQQGVYFVVFMADINDLPNFQIPFTFVYNNATNINVYQNTTPSISGTYDENMFFVITKNFSIANQMILTWNFNTNSTAFTLYISQACPFSDDNVTQCVFPTSNSQQIVIGADNQTILNNILSDGYYIIMAQVNNLQYNMFDGPLSLSFNYEVVYNDTNQTSIPVGPYNTYSFENSEELNFYFTVNCSETDFVQINGYIMNFSQQYPNNTLDIIASNSQQVPQATVYGINNTNFYINYMTFDNNSLINFFCADPNQQQNCTITFLVNQYYEDPSMQISLQVQIFSNLTNSSQIMQLVPNTIVSQVPCPGGRHNQTNNTQEYYFYDFYTYIGPGNTFILNAAFNLNIEQGIFNSTLNPQMIQNPDYSYYQGLVTASQIQQMQNETSIPNQNYWQQAQLATCPNTSTQCTIFIQVAMISFNRSAAQQPFFLSTYNTSLLIPANDSQIYTGSVTYSNQGFFNYFYYLQSQQTSFVQFNQNSTNQTVMTYPYFVSNQNQTITISKSSVFDNYVYSPGYQGNYYYISMVAPNAANQGSGTSATFTTQITTIQNLQPVSNASKINATFDQEYVFAINVLGNTSKEYPVMNFTLPSNPNNATFQFYYSYCSALDSSCISPSPLSLKNKLRSIYNLRSLYSLGANFFTLSPQHQFANISTPTNNTVLLFTVTAVGNTGNEPNVCTIEFEYQTGQKPNNNKKLSGGAIAGIVIGCVAFVIILGFIIYKCKNKGSASGGGDYYNQVKASSKTEN